MLVSKVKKVYSHELEKKFEKEWGEKIKDYKIQQFLADICDSGLYVKDYPENKPRLRITFIPFLFCVMVLYVVAFLKYIFTGSFQFGEKNLIIRKMIAWDKYCRFNIIS